jgi:hypothetical protein
MNQRLVSVLGWGAFIALFAGGMLGYFGWQEWTLFSSGSATPQSIPLADLAANGPGKNVHVTVTNFTFVPKVGIYEEKNGAWQSAWFPVVVPGEPTKAIVVKNFKVKNESQVEAYVESASSSQALTGIITNSIRSLGTEETAKLKNMLPGVDVSKTLVLEEGRSFPSSGSVFGLLGGGILLILVGLGFAFGWWVVKRRAQYTV